MNALKKNPFLTALVAITVIACGALIFLILQAKSQYDETLTSYNNQANTYQQLVSAKTFPSEENLEKLTEFRKQYAEEVVKLLAEVEERQMEVPSLSTNGFQDLLTQKVTAATEVAQQNGVVLPEDFFLGFERYRTTLPNQAAVPLLTLEMEVIDEVVARILQAPAAAITGVERRSLPVEDGQEPAPAPAPRRGSRGSDRDARGAADEPEVMNVLERQTFVVQFTASQANLQEILNNLLELEQLTTMQLVRIRNQETAGPAKEAAAAAAEVDPETGEAIETDAATFVLGAELLEVAIRFQIIRPAENAQQQMEELL